MSQDLSPFREPLDAALQSLGMAQDLGRADQLLAYLQQLHHWNRAYNLTAVRDPADMLVQHVFDSLAVVPAVRGIRAGRDTRIADMGSGAGLPGIILGICQPDWTIFCVDAVGKKTAFVRQAAGVLGLKNVQAVHGRIEALDSLRADVVISRAFASLSDFVRVAGHHRSSDGVMLAMKGQYPHDECQALESATDWTVKSRTVLRVPDMDAQRCLLELGLKEPHDSR
ncbi:16S rRNA (guanine(527)-N(7))-methyltransferase RsmG [uncultured Castellaniella sp.]|uniref:16S rRNA (guanine(527)-N(7))-methyltransferase RsmG n=1 Tax=uncultured Castellaniella sp. TaxID=647907 RepID=UPI00260FB5B4|nr:16S rRNA (guanine(527)-N(7))-methyltransferase RsmG [uncultured Castellaniella sp.]